MLKDMGECRMVSKKMYERGLRCRGICQCCDCDINKCYQYIKDIKGSKYDGVEREVKDSVESLKEIAAIVVEVLTAKISELENEKREISNKLRMYERMRNFSWLAHINVNEEENKDLPLPRLEMRYERNGNNGVDMTYGIVRKHYIDGIEFIPLSQTTTRSCADTILNELIHDIKNENYDGVNKSLPYRDGMHMKYDSLTLGMSIVIRCGEYTYLFVVSDEDKQFIKNVTGNKTL